MFVQGDGELCPQMLTGRARSKHAYLKTHLSPLQKWAISSQYHFLTLQRLLSDTAGSWEAVKGLPANLRAKYPEVWLRLPNWGSTLLGMCSNRGIWQLPKFACERKSCSSALSWCCISEAALHYQSSAVDFVLFSGKTSLHCPHPLFIKPQQRWELLQGRNFILIERCF